MSESKQKKAEPSPCSLPSEAPKAKGLPVQKSEEEWQAQLTPDQYRVLRRNGTEPPFQNQFWDNKAKGLYLCAGCAAPLFSSGEKYDSRSGWPSFWEPMVEQNIGQTADHSHGMTRVEVHCSQCGGHLGHVFEDGPRPTRLRYCINSAALEFVPQSKVDERQLSAYSERSQ